MVISLHSYYSVRYKINQLTIILTQSNRFNKDARGDTAILMCDACSALLQVDSLNKEINVLRLGTSTVYLYLCYGWYSP